MQVWQRVALAIFLPIMRVALNEKIVAFDPFDKLEGTTAGIGWRVRQIGPQFLHGGYASFDNNPLANLRDLILPMITLGTGSVAVNMRQIRANMIEVLGQDYVRAARAKGLSERRVNYVHALRNAMLPLLTIVGLQVGALIAGAFVIETIFLWPGIGQLAVQSILAKDYPVVQGVVLLSALSYMAANLLVDIGYVLLDPRIRLDK